MIAVIAGFAAGCVHVLVGPDHLAAIAPMAVQTRRRAWVAGAVWGVGHSAGLWLVALAALLLRETLPLDGLAVWSERAVGVVLIAVGLWAARKACSARLHAHLHEHGGQPHTHVHVHSADEPHDHPAAHAHTHAAASIGMLHGLAGGAHLLGVLPAVGMPNRVDAVIYLGAFAAGSIAAMAFFGWVVGLAAKRAERAGSGLYRAGLAACGLVSAVVGCAWLLT